MEELLLLEQDLDLFFAHMAWQSEQWEALGLDETRPQLLDYAMLRAAEFRKSASEAEEVNGDLKQFLISRLSLRAHLAEVKLSFLHS